MLVWNDPEADEKIKVYDKGVNITNGESVHDLLVNYRSGDVWAPRVELAEALKVELGYFVGTLKRRGVCVLHEPGVEIPSDFHGVVYVPLDPGGAWRLLLAKEMKAAGLDIDLNKAI